MAKVAFEVDKEKLEAAVKQVESNGPLGSRKVLDSAVAEAYNASNPPREITAAVVSLRLSAWNISLVTPLSKRGRKKVLQAV